MGVIRDHLVSLLSKQIHDQASSCGTTLSRTTSVDLPATNIVRFTDSFFALRHKVEPFLERQEPEPELVYVPLAQEQTHDALVEAGAAGYTLKLPLSVLAGDALRPFFGVKGVASLEKRIGVLLLAE